MQLDKERFYNELSRFRRIKYLPIFFIMSINDTDTVNLVVDMDGKDNKKVTIQIYDRLKNGKDKYLCKDIYIDLVDEKINSEYKLYKYIQKVLDNLEIDYINSKEQSK